MEGTIVLEQLVGIILASIMLIFSIVGPTVYYSFRFVSVKVDELRLQLSNFIRMILERPIGNIYKYTMQTALYTQAILDFLEIIATLSAEKAAEKSFEEEASMLEAEKEALKETKAALQRSYNVYVDRSVSEWIEQDIRAVADDIASLLGTVEKEAMRRALTEVAGSLFSTGALIKVVPYTILLVRGKLTQFAVAVGLVAAIYLLRSVIMGKAGRAMQGMEVTPENLLPVFLTVASIGATFGGYIIMIAEMLFRFSIPTMDKFFYTPVFENVKTRDSNSTLRRIGERIKFCWKAFGAGKWDVNYMRVNPTVCSISLISSSGGNIFLKNVTDYMAGIENEYQQKNKSFFSNGRFVFILKECNGTSGKCDLLNEVECDGLKCKGNLSKEVLSNVNIKVYHKLASGDIEEIGSRNITVGVMHISFGECVTWDVYTEETMEGPFWKKEKFGEKVLWGSKELAFGVSIFGAESLSNLNCLKKDTLYITFLIPKSKFINVTLEEIS